MGSFTPACHCPGPPHHALVHSHRTQTILFTALALTSGQHQSHALPVSPVHAAPDPARPVRVWASHHAGAVAAAAAAAARRVLDHTAWASSSSAAIVKHLRQHEQISNKGREFQGCRGGVGARSVRSARDWHSYRVVYMHAPLEALAQQMLRTAAARFAAVDVVPARPFQVHTEWASSTPSALDCVP